MLQNQQVDHLRFERSVNLMLSQIPKFTVTTDHQVALTGFKTKLCAKVQVLTRSDGSESKPDAILQSGGLTIICDAKLYTNDLPEKVILKTLDDMKLRDTTFGILICSKDTKTTTFDKMMRQN
jgi:hypothetical protein